MAPARDVPAVATDATDLGPGHLLFVVARQAARGWEHLLRDIDPIARRGLVVAGALDALGRGDGATVSDIRDALGVDKSVASRMVADAERSGAVVTRRSPDDSRCKLVAVSPVGQRALADARRRYEQAFRHIAQHWSEAERAETERALRRLLAAATGHANGPPGMSVGRTPTDP